MRDNADTWEWDGREYEVWIRGYTYDMIIRGVNRIAIKQNPSRGEQ